jgi:hypothetical protein
MAGSNAHWPSYESTSGDGHLGTVWQANLDAFTAFDDEFFTLSEPAC